MMEKKSNTVKYTSTEISGEELLHLMEQKGIGSFESSRHQEQQKENMFEYRTFSVIRYGYCHHCGGKGRLVPIEDKICPRCHSEKF